MAIFELIGNTISVISDPATFALLIVATLAGTIIGTIPGMGGVILLSLLIPLTFGMEPVIAFMLLAAANGGTSQGGAVASILLSTPGTAPNAATLIDGFPMTRQGRGGEAIGASAIASGLGAVIGMAVLALSVPIMIEMVLLFGPPEIFWLATWGLASVALVIGDRLRTGLISAGLGLMFAMHGTNFVTAGIRWTYGYDSLLSGVSLVSALVGLFAIAEMIKLVIEGETISLASEDDGIEIGGGKMAGARAVIEHKYLFLRSTLVGVVIGFIPGVGGTVANYLAYFQAVQSSPDSESFGKGDIRGVIAPEASNDAKEGAAFIPTLGFGIPGSTSMAILFVAFLLHGITPGPLLMQQHLDVVMIIIVAALISNIISSIFVFITAEQLVAITKVDIHLVAPIVIAVSFLASFAVNNDIFGIWLTLVFGILGFLMVIANMSRVPMILGMVLGPIIEDNFFRSLQISGGDPSIFFSSVLSLLLISIVITTILWPIISARAGWRVLP